MMDGQAAIDLGSLVERVLVKSILLELKAVRRKPHLFTRFLPTVSRDVIRGSNENQASETVAPNSHM
mgnify:CR=1 FL=1